MSLEWPQNTEAQKPVEKTEQVEANQNLEQELSFEQINLIMQKLQDVRAYGTTFTFVDWLKHKAGEFTDAHDYSKIDKILTEGVLGTPRGAQERTNPEQWRKWLREHGDEPLVFYHVLGRTDRTITYDETSKFVQMDQYGDTSRNYKGTYGSVAILFDLNPQKELPPIPKNYSKNKPIPHILKTGHHKGLYPIKTNGGKTWEESFGNKTPKEVADEKLHLSSDYEGLMNENGETIIFNEVGFVASPRIAPRKFKGIIVQLHGSGYDYNAIKKLSENGLKPGEEEALNQNIDFIIPQLVNSQTKAYKDMPERLLPIYDNAGNLLWPRRLSHEEVKKYIEERDTKNANKEEK